MTQAIKQRAQASPVHVWSFGFLLLSAVALLPISQTVENTIDMGKLAAKSAGIGAVIAGLPLCWWFRHRKYYEKDEYLIQAAMAWLLLIGLAAGVFFDASFLINTYCGPRTKYSMDCEILGYTWNGKHGLWYIYFEFPDFDNQRIMLREGEKKRFKNEKQIVLHLQTGYFGFPIIKNYDAKTNGCSPDK